MTVPSQTISLAELSDWMLWLSPERNGFKEKSDGPEEEEGSFERPTFSLTALE